MASLGHLVVGMAAARVYGADSSAQRASWGAMLGWAALSFLPDADVIGFGLGVRYEDAWGHRGATHSLAFALAVGVAVGLLAPLVRRSAVRTGVMATLVLASHSLLDTFTDGGLGCALLWPFDDTRYFAPWRPLPVSPIGLGYLSPYGMYVAATETALFAPVLWYAFRSRPGAHTATSRGSARALLIIGWLLSIWLLMSSNPLRERAVGLVLGEIPSSRLAYSRSLDHGYHRARGVCFDSDRVGNVVKRWLEE